MNDAGFPHTASPDLLVERRSDHVLSVTLNRPEAGNVITAAMFDTLIGILRDEAVAPTARVLTIRAQGTEFCIGRDRTGTDAASIREEVARLIEFKRLLRASPMITIAEIHGDAFGFGFGMGIVCDLTIVSTAARLGFPEMQHGLPPAAIMAYLGRYSLPKQAFPMVLFGEPFTPADALRAGLVTAVCEPEALAAETARLEQRILALNADSARQCKAFYQIAEEATLEQNFRCATETLTVASLRLRDAAQKKAPRPAEQK